MNITPVTTHKITTKDTNIFEVLDAYLPKLQENSIIAITSKIIAITEGSVVEMSSTTKDDLVKQEADQYLAAEENNYHVYLTMKDNFIMPSAGIDESNADGKYILWPKNSQKSANDIREYLTKKHNLKHIGILITDSKTNPLRWGTSGIPLAHSGFLAIHNYIGKKDIFGREMEVTKANLADGLAAAAVLVIGEGAEQTPLAVIEDIPFVEFQNRNPTKEELDQIKVDLDDDIYAPLLKGVDWQQGDGEK